jgi:thioredoxin 1
MSLTPVDDATFAEDVLGADKPVLVDFWAERCLPCVMLARTLEDVADQLGDQLTIVAVNVDENPLTPSRYGVSALPALILFKDGKPAASMTGSLPKTRLTEWVKSNL